MKATATTTKAALLAKILAPNQNLAPSGSGVLIVTTDQFTLGGNIIAQNDAAITLCQPNGEIRIVGRQNIQGQVNLGVSSMPEGLETGLSQQDLADLLEYLSP